MPKLPDLDGMIAGYMPDFVVGGEGMPAIWKVDVQRILVAYGRAVAEACAEICEEHKIKQSGEVEFYINENCDTLSAAIREATKEIGK